MKQMLRGFRSTRRVAMGEVTGKPLPRRLWAENTLPTAEQLITYLRGVWTKDAIPVMQRILDDADLGFNCHVANHREAMAENFDLRVEVARLREQLAQYEGMEIGRRHHRKGSLG